MTKVYIDDTEGPVYVVYDVKPQGYPTDEIELTEDELTHLRNTEEATAECNDMIRTKLLEAHARRTT